MLHATNDAPRQIERPASLIGLGIQATPDQELLEGATHLKPGLCVCLTITDTGTGIAPEVIDKMFEPFISTKAPGRGLGLAAVQGIVHNHHGHIEVNGRRVTIPSHLVKPGDVIAPKQNERTAKLVARALEATKGRPVPAWLEVNPEPLQGRVLRLPAREDVSIDVREQLVVELCSK